MLWLSLAFLAGILLANQLHLSRTFWLGLAYIVLPPQFHLFRIIWLILAGIVLLIASLLRILSNRLNFRPFNLPPSTLFLASLSLITFFLGAARYHFSIPIIDTHHIAWYDDRQ
ncbi:MAG: hypothetical protein Q8M58_11535, partial [Anaerolineales bacterium]|nr:hypothetical protein [Anaerolineales bacterium]